MHIHKNAALKSFHTFGLDVKARHLVEARKPEDYQRIWETYPSIPKLILGEGSNVVFCSDYSGVVVLNRLKGIDVSEDENAFFVHVGGGENWHDFVEWALKHQMYGLENLALIPGVVGSAPIQNIGAYGVEFSEFCAYVDVVMIDSWQVKRLTRDECQLGYRDSVFKHVLKDKAIVIAVGFCFPKSWQPQIDYAPLNQLSQRADLTPELIFDTVCATRKEKLPDPKLVGNAGSFFKNPIISQSQSRTLQQQYPHIPLYAQSNKQVKVAAGWLIEQAGMKNIPVGDAVVYHKQALVITNRGNATPEDIVELARLIVERVEERFGIRLEHEVRFIDQYGETKLDALCQA